MAMAAEVLTAEAWLRWATNAFKGQREDYERFEDYYVGDHVLEFATDRWQESFGDEFEEFEANMCGVVVDSLAQRLEVVGWRTEAKDKTATKAAEDLWDENELEVEEEDLYVGSISKGDGYIISWPDGALPELKENEEEIAEDQQREVSIMYHDALDVTVAYDPEDRRRIIRAAKTWRDEKNQAHMRLYFPDRVERYIIPVTGANAEFYLQFRDWSDRSQPLPEGWEKEEADIVHDLGIVPVFHFKNRRGNSTHGVSEIKDVIPIQNALNKLFMDLMVGSEFGSFRQKWMAGGGHPKEGWKAGPNRFWATTDPQARFGEFGQIDLEGMIRAVEMAMGVVAKITQTPLHYLRSSGDMPSGEALKTAESGLVKKAENRQKVWGRQWSHVMTSAVEWKIGRAPKSAILPVWKTAETRHDLEQAQTAQLESLLGIPLKEIWIRRLGATEEEAEAWIKENRAVAATLLAQVASQTGQTPPGLDTVGLEGTQELQGLDIAQVLAILGKGKTSQTTGGEATPNPQPNTVPPASPTRRSRGFKD